MIPRPLVPLILFSLFPIVLAASCATTAPAAEPSLHSESSSGAIRAAEEVGAARTPSAALHLQLAKEQFEQARRTTPDPMDRDRADRLLMRAQADAELSLVLARSEADKVEAQQAIDKVKALKATTVQ
jgi:hypothetical protein